MNDATICLKTINDLLKERFFVPAYQRGYRWNKRQVKDLLDDLWEFQSKSENQKKESFYCLQPVVVKKRDDGSWELVDGQQRLTTIFILLTQLEPILKLFRKTRFTLDFETRGNSCRAFLENIDPLKRGNNIDYHHICDARDAIETWLAEDKRDGGHSFKLLQCLLNTDELGRNVKVIWYELPETEDSVEVFTRLNVGKIPLTNAELIRALFLQSGNFDVGTVSLQQIKIAQEWDGIEKTLQRDEIWYFLHRGDDSPPNRIEYLFQLIARKKTRIDPSEEDDFCTFRFYSEKFKERAVKADSEWLTIKQYFMTLEEWFSDRILYHLIGYLIHDGDDLIEIRKAAAGSDSKSAFQIILKQRIFKRCIGSELATHNGCGAVKAAIAAKITGLEYKDDSAAVRAVLLLFNIATLLQNANSNLRFPFDRYKQDQWDIEHVRAVESGKPNKAGDKLNWLKCAFECLNDNEEERALRASIGSTLDTNQCDNNRFDEFYQEMLRHFPEDPETEPDNSISNLALLDAATNRSYKNAPFSQKRRVILQRDKNGTFIPLCTKNVFLKCYSRRINNMMGWDECDKMDYLNTIIETLADFFVPQNGGLV